MRRARISLIPCVTDEIHGDINYADPLPQLFSHSIHILRRLTHLFGIADSLGDLIEPLLKSMNEVRWDRGVDAHNLILDRIRGQVNDNRRIVASAAVIS